MKRLKRIVAFLLLVVLVFTTNLIQVSASTTGSDETEKTFSRTVDALLSEGSYYVPLKVESGIEVNTNIAYVGDKYRTALLSVDQDGRYFLTLRIGKVKDSLYDQYKGIKIAKEDYVDKVTWYDSKGTVGVNTYNNADYWRVNKSVNGDIDNEGITESDTYIAVNDRYGYADVKILVKDITKPIIIVDMMDNVNIEKTKQTGNGAKISIAYALAEKLPVIEDGIYNWTYVLENSYYTGGYAQATYDSSAAESIKGVIESDVSVEVKGKTATATFNFNEAYKAKGNVRLPSEYVYDEANQGIAPSSAKYYKKVTVTDGTFKIEYDLNDWDGMVFGPVVRIAKTSSGNAWYGTLRLTQKSDEAVTLEDKDTGIIYETTTANVSKSDKLQVTTNTTGEGDVFSKLKGEFEGRVKSITYYDIKVVTSDGKEVPITGSGTLKIKIPDGYIVSQTKGKGLRADGAGITVGTIQDGYVCIENSSLGQYAVTEDYGWTTTSAELEDGVYTVEWFINHKNEDGNSMADNAFVKPATLIVKGDKVILEMTQQGVVLGDIRYVSRMEIQHVNADMQEDGETISTIPYSYIKNKETGELYTTQYSAGRQVYYPYSAEKLYIELPKGETGCYKAMFRIPVMDALSSLNTGRVGGADNWGYLLIDYTTAVKQKDIEVTDAPLDEALEAAIEVAGRIKKEESTEVSWTESKYDEVLEAAKKVKKNSEASREEKETARKNLQDAIDTVTDHYLKGSKYKAGYYKADASLSDDGAAISDTVFQVNEKPDMTTDFSIRAEGITTFSYYDVHTRGYIEAEAVPGEREGETAFKYTLKPSAIVNGEQDANVYESLAVKYTDKNGLKHETWLNLSNIESYDPDEKDPEDNGDEDTPILDIHNLEDGVYTVQGTMVRSDDKTINSMSDGAIDHNIKLTVKDGTYSVTMEFGSLTINLAGINFQGYLKQLKYYCTGYSAENNGIKGTLTDVKVDSYHTNEDGTFVKDELGTDYPKSVTFALIPEALEDGYVPLQVFVPVMDKISSGTGTQSVYLKLDYSTLKKEMAVVTGPAIVTGTPIATRTPEVTPTQKPIVPGGDIGTAVTDGIYTVNVTMRNASNPAQASMADNAVVKPVTVTVNNGKYTIIADFRGININLMGKSFFGYLKELSYKNANGNYVAAIVNSYYDIKDAYNTKADGSIAYQYPKQISFPLVNGTKGDTPEGYVELQVFVPIMEGISTGTGTQKVYMDIDWSTLKKSTGTTVTEPTTGGNGDTENVPTPVVSETPAATETVTPKETQAPMSSAIPEETETVIPSETPKGTETVAPSETPEETETVVPSETPKETETVVSSEIPKETKTPVLSETPKAEQTAVPSETPAATVTPSINVQPGEEQLPNAPVSQETTALKKNQKIIVGKNTYVVTNTGKNATVKLVSTKSKSPAFTVPAVIKVNGVTYRVTAIKANAFKNNKKITSVVISKNVTTIGKNAFYGAKNLKKITIKSKSLTNIGAKSLKGISSKVVIKLPSGLTKKQKKALKNKLIKAGISKKVTWK